MIDVNFRICTEGLLFFFWGGPSHVSQYLAEIPSETNIVPENGWLEYHRFLLGWPILMGKIHLSFRGCMLLNSAIDPAKFGLSMVAGCNLHPLKTPVV